MAIQIKIHDVGQPKPSFNTSMLDIGSTMNYPPKMTLEVTNGDLKRLLYMTTVRYLGETVNPLINPRVLNFRKGLYQ